MATVYKRASAKRDLVEDYVYLAEHAGTETAERFLSSADESFGDLARHPGMGTALSLYDPKLAELRKWRVNGFEKFLIFYLPGRTKSGLLPIIPALCFPGSDAVKLHHYQFPAWACLHAKNHGVSRDVESQGHFCAPYKMRLISTTSSCTR